MLKTSQSNSRRRRLAGETDEHLSDLVAARHHRWTVDEYLHAVRVLGWESTELVEGVVYDVTPDCNRHARTVMQVLFALHQALPDDEVRNAGSVQVSETSMFDPDVYVIDRRLDIDPEGAVPVAAVKLAVEVTVTTHAIDRGPKLTAYAKAGVPEVWLLDPRPESGELLRHRDPHGSSYRTIDHFAVGANAEALDVSVVLGR